MSCECTLSKREARHALARLAVLMPHNGTPPPSLSDPDGLHDVRVACRRGRVFLSEFGDNLPDGPTRKARKRLRKMGRRLGEARELDVSIALACDWPTEDAAARAYVVARLETDRGYAQAKVAEAQEQLATAEIGAAVAKAKDGFEPSTACHLRHARDRLRKRLKKLQSLYAAWWTSRLDEDLHLVRIRLKKFRYSVEVYHRLYGRSADKFLHQLEAAQDSLGRWNDLRSLRNRILPMEADAPRELRAGIAALAASVGEDADATRERVREELAAFFDKDAMKEYRKLFGDWSRKCCRGAR